MNRMNCHLRRLWQIAILLSFALSYAQGLDAAPQNPTNNPPEFFPIDLSRFVTTVFSNAPQGSMWNSMPHENKTFQGVPFKIDGKFEVTGMEALRNSSEYIPTRVSGIPIGRKAEKLVLLHGTGWVDKDGVPMAKLVLHYANGEERSMRIIYGVHVRNWYEERSERKKTLADPNSSVAWNSGEDDPDRGSPLRLFKTTFQNPLPDQAIKEIEFVSLFSHAPPLIVALTLQTGGPDLQPATTTAAKHIIKKGTTEPDSTYTRTLMVRALAADSGGSLTNARLFPTVTDEQSSYSFGFYKADAQGVLAFDYPPRQTLSLNLLITTPGRAPLVLAPRRGTDGSFPASLEAKLPVGETIGGTVVDETGKPVSDAKILISSVTRTKPKVYSQFDFDQVRTDSAGHWQSSSLPHGFTNLVLQLSHPEYRATVYQQSVTNTVAATNAASTTNAAARTPGFAQRLDAVVVAKTALASNVARTAAAPIIKTNLIEAKELLAGKSVLVMRHGLLVQGTVRGDTNSPIANAEVYFFENLNSPKNRRLARTGKDGRFSFVATAETGEAALAAVANGFAPRYEAFFLETAAKPFEFGLGQGSPVKARVMDNEQKPVTDATVKLEQWNNTQIIKWQGQTDADGHFTWTNAPEGPLLFSVSKTNYFDTRINLIASGGETMLTMRKTSNASGTVVDAETKKPIDEFTIIKGHSYNPGEPIRWNRYGYVLARGRNGRYSVRLEDYYNGQSKIMIEAPGYMPVVSEAFTKPGWYSNHFELKKGRGFSGTIVFANGEPAANCSVVIVDPGDSASINQIGELRANSSNRDFARTDLQGKFEFPPKAEVQTILAAHDKGFAQVQTDQLPADGKIVLQPWGQIKGTVKVGTKPEPGRKVVLQSRYPRYSDGGRQQPLSLYVQVPVDAQGNFSFNKVPAGDRMVGILYEAGTRNYSRTAVSHGVPVGVKSGETNLVTIGGTGRTILGRVSVLGGEQGDVDWKRDIHTMSLRLPANPENEAVTMPGGLTTQEEQQKFWQARNERMKEFWKSEKGRALEEKQRSYVLAFETNGTFHIDNVPPGTYDIYISVTDPNDDESNYRQIGSLSKQFVIPDGAADVPFDTGTHELRIRKQLRIGQMAPAFEGKSLDGKAIKLQDYRGKFVLLNFGAKWSGNYASEVQVLKALNDTYGKDGRLVIIGLSVDYQEQTAKDMVKETGITWPECYLGQWSETSVPGMFGVEGIPHSVLIGPTGTVAAKNLQGTYMKTAVRNAIESKATVSASRNN